MRFNHKYKCKNTGMINTATIQELSLMGYFNNEHHVQLGRHACQHTNIRQRRVWLGTQTRVSTPPCSDVGIEICTELPKCVVGGSVLHICQHYEKQVTHIICKLRHSRQVGAHDLQPQRLRTKMKHYILEPPHMANLILCDNKTSHQIFCHREIHSTDGAYIE